MSITLPSVEDVAAFARDWCRRFGVPESLTSDMMQEAQVAALEHAGDLAAVGRALNRLRMREYRRGSRERPAMDEVLADLGWEYDGQYHGMHRDDA